MSRLRVVFGDKRGAALPFLAVSLVALLAVLALAIDLGMLWTARTEAQRAADAIALAGASAFIENQPDNFVGDAKARAKEIAGSNHIRNILIDTSTVSDVNNLFVGEEVAVEVLPSEFKVRATVRRTGIPLSFARLLGLRESGVAGYAAAAAVEAGSAQCVKPFAIPDEGFTVNDYGKEVIIKSNNTAESEVESFYFPIVVPQNEHAPLEPGCPMGTGGNVMWDDECTDPDGQGACWYRLNICRNNCAELQLQTPYDIEPGNMTGPTAMGINSLITQDPDLKWDDVSNQLVRCDGGICHAVDPRQTESTRIITVPTYDKSTYTDPGRRQITFNGFALFFLDDGPSAWGGHQNVYHPNGADPVIGRFLFYAPGSGSGPASTPFTRYLRLVE